MAFSKTQLFDFRFPCYIIALFASMYLLRRNPYINLFDEPLTQKDKYDKDLHVLFSVVKLIELKQLPKPIPI